MFELQKKLADTARVTLEKEYGVSTEVHFDVSFDEQKGDFTSSIALQVAKNVGKRPQEVAQMLATALRTLSSVTDVVVAGPGFVNITVDPAALLQEIAAQSSSLTMPTPDRGEAPVLMDYSSPNIAKPLGIHHILSTVIGQSLNNVYKFLGYKVVAINHIGDWGTQFGKLFVAHRMWGTKPIAEHTIDELLDLYVRFHKEVDVTPALEDDARAVFARLEAGDVEIRAFWSASVAVTMKAMEGTYRRLHVAFDEVIGESFYEDKMMSIVDEGKRNGVFVPGKDGALIAQFPEEEKLPPALVLKGDGSTIYITRDFATVRYRIDRWQPQSILYIVDIAQQLHFKQLFRVIDLLGWKHPHLEHIIFGRMNFSDGSMSTRMGNIVRLEEVLDEGKRRAAELIKERGEKIQTDDPDALAEMMGVGAVVYGVLSQNRLMDMIFDWSKVLTFEGNSAPYIQYTYARARSVLRKAGVDGVFGTDGTTVTSKEKLLLKQLMEFRSAVHAARADHLPHKVTTYLYTLAQSFNAFYASEPILTAEGAVRDRRLALTSLTASVLRCGAELLTLRVPERM